MPQSPLHAKYYADQAIHQTAEVVSLGQLAKETHQLRLNCESIAKLVKPGQFLMFKLHGYDDPLLGRALALYDTVLDDSGEPIGIDVVFLVMGKMTAKLAAISTGAKIDLWGPLGNGFIIPEIDHLIDHLIMVAGGIGQTPFLALAKQALGQKSYGQSASIEAKAKKVTFCYGARNAQYLAGLDDFEQTGIEVKISTDDGSAGHHGLVTDLLIEQLAGSKSTTSTLVVCCGPEPMMEAVAKVCADRSVACQVSLETPMACGIGICFSCVTKVKDESGQWDFKRTCVDGPVFDAASIQW